MKQLNASIRRVNKGIGSDAFLISCESTKYIMRIENNSAHSKIKIERHEKILRILKKEKFVQKFGAGVDKHFKKTRIKLV